MVCEGCDEEVCGATYASRCLLGCNISRYTCRGKAERLPDSSEHGDEGYNAIMSGQSAQSLKRPLIPSSEPSSHGPSEHGAVRGTYALSLPEEGSAAGVDVEVGSGVLDDEGVPHSHTDDV